MLQESLLITRISLVSATLLYTSYLDWKYREVDDKAWIISGVLATILTVFDLAHRWSMDKLLLSILSIGFSSSLAFGFYFLGLYGGADAKAILIVSLGLPLHQTDRSLHPFTGLATLTNGLIFSLILPLTILIYNLTQLIKKRDIFEGFHHESTIRKLLALMFGVRLKNARNRRFWFLMEEADHTRRFKFGLFSLELSEIDRDDVWATPGIPLIIFITAGFLYYILLGDISYTFFRTLLQILNLRT
ncbi:MAG: prepilin peptidase [Thaumarchaeota archaeon]|jgi:preflagellin peptidase FlaK|nr:prepilin peptidase [Candidatus Geocrenenecus arthurdayi]